MDSDFNLDFYGEEIDKDSLLIEDLEKLENEQANAKARAFMASHDVTNVFDIEQAIPLVRLSSVFSDLSEVLKPPPRESVSTTVEKIMYLPSRVGLSQPFRVDGKVSYMREPMDLLNSRHFNELVFMGCARTGKTEALVKGFASYAMFTARDIMIFQMSGDKALEFAKKEFQPTIYASPQLKALLGKKKEDANLTTYKLKQGSWVLIRKPAVSDLASTTVQYVVLTDYDRMDQNVGGEGSPWVLARARTTTYGFDAMAVVESSPGFPVMTPEQRLEPHDSYDCAGIAALYNTGDQRCYYFQCLSCFEWYWARPETIKWDTSIDDDRLASKTAHVLCPHCGRRHTDRERLNKLIPNGKWLRKGEHIDKDGNITGEPKISKTASFWLRAPACAFISLEEIVYRYLSAFRQYKNTGDDQNLKAVVNTVFGDPYVPMSSSDSAAIVYEKESQSFKNADRGIAPRDTVLIVACVDVQNGANSHFVAQIFALTKQAKIHLIDRFDIKEYKGKKIRAEIDDSSQWDVLDELVIEYKAKIAETDYYMLPHMTIVDSGGGKSTTSNAYAFYKRMRELGKTNRLRLSKGMSVKNRPMTVQGRETWAIYANANDVRSKAYIQGIQLFKIVPNYYKTKLFNLLQRPVDQPLSITFNKDIPKEVYSELTAERLNEKGEYVKQYNGIHNEALDLFVYFLAYIDSENIEQRVMKQLWLPWLCTAEEGCVNAFDSRTDETLAPAQEPNKYKKVTKPKKVSRFSAIKKRF